MAEEQGGGGRNAHAPERHLEASEGALRVRLPEADHREAEQADLAGDPLVGEGALAALQLPGAEGERLVVHTFVLLKTGRGGHTSVTTPPETFSGHKILCQLTVINFQLAA